MSNTHRHNKKAKYKKISVGNDQWWILYEKVHGHNWHDKKTRISRKFNQKKFRTEEKKALHRIETNQDDTIFPLNPRTEGYNTN
jgi:hypothetical protein